MGGGGRRPRGAGSPARGPQWPGIPVPSAFIQGPLVPGTGWGSARAGWLSPLEDFWGKRSPWGSQAQVQSPVNTGCVCMDDIQINKWRRLADTASRSVETNWYVSGAFAGSSAHFEQSVTRPFINPPGKCGRMEGRQHGKVWYPGRATAESCLRARRQSLEAWRAALCCGPASRCGPQPRSSPPSLPSSGLFLGCPLDERSGTGGLRDTWCGSCRAAPGGRTGWRQVRLGGNVEGVLRGLLFPGGHCKLCKVSLILVGIVLCPRPLGP